MYTPLKGLMLTGGTLALAALTIPSAALAASPPSKASRTIAVDNTRPEPVVVYLERGEIDAKLGTVGANSIGDLTVPRYLDLDETARVVVHPAQGTDLRSPDITVPDHGTLKVLVPNNDTGYLPQPRIMMPDLDPNATTLTVENPRAQSVSVVIQSGDFDRTIGTVGADQTRTFTLPASLTRDSQNVQLFLRPEEGLDLSSQYITLNPRAHLEVTVPLKG
ncbi:MAG: hypothetical protein PVJ02_19720 [Gemmatimonadota bacterium]|jgi:hypothetical protein